MTTGMMTMIGTTTMMTAEGVLADGKTEIN